MIRPHRLSGGGVVLAVALLIPFSSNPAGAPGAASQRGCAYAGDTTTWARERLGIAAVPEATVSEVLIRLELATQECPGNRDLWHLRAAAEDRLGRSADAEYSARRARAGQSGGGLEQRPVFARALADAPASPVRDKWALVIGVGQFLGGSLEIPLAAKDARDLAGVLIDPEVGRFKPSNVQLLTDEQATLRGVKTAIGWLRTRVHPDDLVVTYIASHGSPRSRDPDGVSYVIVHDTDPRTPETLYGTSLHMIDLVQDLARDLNVARSVIVLDTCFSGGAAGTARLPGVITQSEFSGAARIGTSMPGRALFAASRADQQSWQSPALGNGYFTYYLIEELRASKGMAPLNALFLNVRDKVSAAVQRDVSAIQRPVLEGTASAGAIVLGAAPRPGLPPVRH